jgi:hypothetical protein
MITQPPITPDIANPQGAVKIEMPSSITMEFRRIGISREHGIVSEIEFVDGRDSVADVAIKLYLVTSLIRLPLIIDTPMILLRLIDYSVGQMNDVQ